MRDVKAVVHLACIVGTYTLEDLFRVNARGLFECSEAARLAGVQRIVFASSNHAFGFYPISEKVSPALPPRPDTTYGVFRSGRDDAAPLLRSLRHPIGVAAHRHLSRAAHRPALARDLVSLRWWHLGGRRTAPHRHPGCMVVNGYSNNTRLKTFDPNWATLGYQPKDNAEDHREAAARRGRRRRCARPRRMGMAGARRPVPPPACPEAGWSRPSRPERIVRPSTFLSEGRTQLEAPRLPRSAGTVPRGAEGS